MSSIPEDQTAELGQQYPGVQSAVEGGVTYFLLPQLELPPGCQPTPVNALLCPSPRDGYTSRLFFAEHVQGGPARNWNTNGERILESTWYAFSWQTRAGLRLCQMVLVHLEGLKV